MIRRARSALFLLFLAQISGFASSLAASEIPFSSRMPIEDPFEFARSLASADFDRDGDLDVVAVARDSAQVSWWENTAGDGSAWTRNDLSTSFDQPHDVAVGDIDDDGDVDVVATSYSGDSVSWWENDLGSGAACGFDFCGHVVEALNGADAVDVADIDGDGDLDIVATSSNSHRVRWYASSGAGTSWTPENIATSFSGAGAVSVADLDGDGDLDVVGGAGGGSGELAWWENDLGSTAACGSNWCPHSLDTGGTDAVAVGDLDGDGDPDVLRAESGALSWWRNDAGDASAWTEVSLSNTSAELGLAAGDVDGDGDLDVVGLVSGWLENAAGDASSWVERPLPGSVADAFDVELADLDGDGDLDLAVARGAGREVAWWRNETLHRTVLYPTGLDVGATLGSAAEVVAADLDGDGDDDVVAAGVGGVLRWSENDGSPLDGGWTDRTIATNSGMEGLVAADLDGDGDLDLAVCEIGADQVRWYENDGTPDDGWSGHTVATSLSAPFFLAASDLDGDGDLDLVASSRDGDRVQWFENDGTPADGTWVKSTVVNGLDFPLGVATADVDGDGDLDVVAAATIDDVVVWVENDGTPTDGGWIRHDIASFNGALGVTSCDPDRDGDIDVVATAQVANDVAWFESDGAAVPSWTAHTINGGLAGAKVVRCGDLDRDGDLDVAATGANADDVRVWFSDATPADGGWTQLIVDGNFDGAYGLAIADLDRDGSLDLLATASNDELVRWWAATGGQFALPTADAVTTTDPNPGDTDVLLLEVDGSHLGRSGDGDFELATLVLAFLDAADDPLSGSQLDGLVETVRLYLDDGDGTFEPDTDDTNFFSVGSPFPDPAVLELAMVDGDPNVQVAFGADVTWWVAVDLAAGAAGATPDAFRVAHITQSGLLVPILSTGEMSTTDLPLELEEQDVVLSSVIDVNHPPTLDTTIADDSVYAGQPYSRDVSGHFSDPEGGALTFGATGLPGSLAISAAGVISGTTTTSDVAGLPYAVTVIATDPSGGTGMGSFTLTILANGTIVVDGTCTLTDAILSANTDTDMGDCTGSGGIETIVLDVDVTLSAADTNHSSDVEEARAGLPDITTEMRIEAGLGSTIARESSLGCLSDGVDHFRLLQVLDGGGLTLVGITLENGCAPRGGAVYVIGNGVYLEAIDSTFRANAAQGVSTNLWTSEGGAILMGMGTELSLEGCLFEGNRSSSAVSGNALGGAIRLREGSLAAEISTTDFVGNVAESGDSSSFAGEASGGAIDSLHPLAVVDAIFSGNEALGGDGIGGANGGGAAGGAITLGSIVSGSSWILGAVFDGNRAVGGDSPSGLAGDASGGAIAGGQFPIEDVYITGGGAFGGDGVTGGDARGGALAASPSMLRVTIAGVRADGGSGSSGDGGSAYGGGLVTDSGLTWAQVTLSGNEAVGGDSTGAAGGAGEGGGAYFDDDVGVLGHLTVVGNSARGGSGTTVGLAAGGGLSIQGDGDIVSSILADNSTTDGGGTPTANDCSTSSPITSLGFNVVETPGTCTFAATGDQSGIAPGASALGRYGCATPLPDGGCLPVHPIDIAGAAVDQGSCTASGATLDARGFARPFDLAGAANADDGCDAGAYEVQDANGNGIDDGFEIFADGFEAGDTATWTTTVP